jgi:hypothetical protein
MDDVEVDDAARFEEQRAALEQAEAANPDREPIVITGARGARSFTLYQPIKVDGRLLTRISIRPPVGGDIDDWGNGTVKSAREMLARLTGLHPAVIRGLDSIDLEILYKMFWDMVPDWLRDTAAGEA